MVFVPVQVRLAVDSETRKIDRSGPMMVWSEERVNGPSGFYEPDPTVLAQLTESEAEGRFLGEWDGTRWRFGKRLYDA